MTHEVVDPKTNQVLTVSPGIKEPGLKDRLEAARAEVARLERQAAVATCAEVGHRWKFTGGMNCGCFEHSGCSVDVHTCEVCGDCDYGDTPANDEIRKNCRHRIEMEEAGPDA